jgi:hypothetical protein
VQRSPEKPPTTEVDALGYSAQARRVPQGVVPRFGLETVCSVTHRRGGLPRGRYVARRVAGGYSARRGLVAQDLDEQLVGLRRVDGTHQALASGIVGREHEYLRLGTAGERRQSAVIVAST